jgi:hypothetical protein
VVFQVGIVGAGIVPIQFHGSQFALEMDLPAVVKADPIDAVVRTTGTRRQPEMPGEALAELLLGVVVSGEDTADQGANLGVRQH